MEATLDTNVIIHLYNANMQSILFERFKNIKVYEFIKNHEMKNHASKKVISEFDKDVKSKKIQLITDEFLININMKRLFDEHVKELKILFLNSDLGEVYTISLAKTLGIQYLITDDIKEYGPHYTLIRILDSEIIPFTFYELLFFDYLEGKVSKSELVNKFNLISKVSQLNMNCLTKLKNFVKRFWQNPYNEKEKVWIDEFCQMNNINAKKRLNSIFKYLLSL